jgi:hypothetical protein
MNVTGKRLETISLKFPKETAKNIEKNIELAKELPFLPNMTALPAHGAAHDLEIRFELPTGYKINSKAPSSWTAYAKTGDGFVSKAHGKITSEHFSAAVADSHTLDLSVYYCPAKESDVAACEIKSFRVPLMARKKSEPLKIKI